MARKPQQGLTYHRMFMDRILLEGREDEYMRLIKEEQERTGKLFTQCASVVRKRMGYSGKGEKAMYERRQRLVRGDILESKLFSERDAVRKERVVELFEDALRSLPDKAPIQDEIDWIRAHPAMMRRSRTKDKLKDVVLEVDDILAAPHGPAPSKSAVAALQHWVNSPNEFFKQLLSQQKKTTTEDPDPAKGAVKDAGIEDIRDMLAKVRVD